MKLVPNAKVLHKTYTIIFSIFLIVLSVLEIAQPYIATLGGVISPAMFPWITAGLGIAIGVGNYIKQDIEADGVLDGRTEKKD